ncbi:MAG TPA: chloride channel protein [Candidatus Acidoferrales bacterium]|nr:chloride channel protein [Candidatus Acidoferrales bacterium]
MMTRFQSRLMSHPRLRKYAAFVHEDLTATYSRDLHRWLIVAPVMGVLTGLLITLIAQVILKWMWPPILRFYLAHPFIMIPGVLGGFIIAGLIMQFMTPDPNQHSTEEIIRSYHDHQGDIQMRPFLPKLIAAIATVGFGGSAALEGPSIYGGGALGSWLWAKVRRIGFLPRDRRIMVISGAAAGMSAVFRAPLTGIIFALEMPYKDDLAHEALLPALIASVTSYATMAAFLGAQPLFDFASSETYTRRDLLWSALLGVICGLVAMAFDITFRRARHFCVQLSVPHWIKMAVGGVLTGACGLLFVSIYKGGLAPIGANYEAVRMILQESHNSLELVVFGFLKLAATLFSLGVGGVSAMFVPLFLTGGSFGAAFAQSIAHSPSIDLYAAVGMAAFIAAGYKTPLTAVVFVAEATGGHAYIIPALIGAAVAYAVSGEASVSGDQRLHEGLRASELSKMAVNEVMQKRVVSVEADSMLRQFADSINAQHSHAVYPAYDLGEVVGTISVSALARVSPQKWDQTKVRDVMDRQVRIVVPECDLEEALRLLMGQNGQHMLLVKAADTGKLEGVLTKTDILSALDTRATGGANNISEAGVEY